MPAWKINLYNFWNGRRVILGIGDPTDLQSAVMVSEDAPLPVKVIGGSVGGGGGTAQSVTQVYAPQTIAIDNSEKSLTIPAGANRAQITVMSGSVRMGLGDAANAPIYKVNEGLIELAGAQLGGLKLTREGATDGSVRVDYWKVM